MVLPPLGATSEPPALTARRHASSSGLAVVTLNLARFSRRRAKRLFRPGDCSKPRESMVTIFDPEFLLWLEGRWREDADELHSAHRTGIHAGMHAVVLRRSSRKVRRDDCRPVLCRYHHAWQFGRGGNRAATTYALYRSAVVVMTAFFWVPVVGLGRREPEGTS
jgi:hypothetical protein